MKIIKNGVEQNISELIKKYEIELSTNNVVTLCSADHLEHIAAYMAWNTVGGRIFIKAPFLTTEQSLHLDKCVNDLNYNDCLIFHSSGTTGMPKLAVHQRHQMDEAQTASIKTMAWRESDNYLNLLPAFTVGFWHLILTVLPKVKFNIFLGSRETLLEDLKYNCNVSIIVPALIDQLRIRSQDVSFSKFDRLGTGSAAVLPRHAEFFFKNGGKKLINIYGATEFCTPVLCGVFTEIDDTIGYIDLTPLANEEFKIVDNVLYVKGKSLCSNIEDFGTVDGWFNTKDRWQQRGNFIKFDGRTNDVVKLNGFSASLLAIETTAEDYTNLGDTIAVVRNSLGTDWIELFFTNKEHSIDKQQLQETFKKHIPEYSVPRKFTWIESIPRNGMGKKVRANNL